MTVSRSTSDRTSPVFRQNRKFSIFVSPWMATRRISPRSRISWSFSAIGSWDKAKSMKG